VEGSAVSTAQRSCDASKIPTAVCGNLQFRKDLDLKEYFKKLAYFSAPENTHP
jgi:hypothetical protein